MAATKTRNDTRGWKVLRDLHTRGVEVYVRDGRLKATHVTEDGVSESELEILRRNKNLLRPLAEWKEEEADELVREIYRWLGNRMEEDDAKAVMEEQRGRIGEIYLGRRMGALRMLLRDLAEENY